MGEHDPSDHICLAEDANGERYTSHSFAQNGVPWRGATILSDRVVASLRSRGLLPLREVSRG